MFIRSTNTKNEKGVTLIELIMVVMIISLLTAGLVRVINPGRQREYAEEATMRANLSKLCVSLQAYYQGENETLPAEGANNNPLEAGAGNEDLASVYVLTWPSGPNGPNDYQYNLAADGTSFAIHIQRTLNDGFFKCSNFWDDIRECASTTDNTDVFDCD